MKPGLVVTLRVNPQDAMSIVDTLFDLGVNTTNLSFNQATKLVLASFLEAHRSTGRIPTRSGFEYTELMRPFTESSYSNRGLKLKLASMLASPVDDDSSSPIEAITDPDKRKRRILYDELLLRKQSGDGWTDTDQAELKPLLEEFFT